VRSARVRLGTIVVAVGLILGGLGLLALLASPSKSPTGPHLPSRSPPITFGAVAPNYVGSWIWYNFTVTSAQPNLTWSVLSFTFVPGPLTKSPSNWSVCALNPSSGIAADYSLHSGNWTTTSTAPVGAQDFVVLRTDSSLTLGEFVVTWTSFGGGAYSEGLL
jgi:hypothetical protein